MLMSEVTAVIIRYIRPPQHGHTSQYLGHDSHLFRSMSIGRPIPETRLFQTLTLKLLGVVKGQGHTIGPVSYYFASFLFHINQTNNSWDTAISKFDLETSKVKVMSEVKCQGHILYPVSNRRLSFSFHINQTNHSCDMAKIVFNLEQGKSEGFESCDWPIVRKRPIWVKIGDVLYRVTLKFDGWPWKTIGHLSFAVSSFVQHFIAIGEFKLELQSENAHFGSNSTIFRAVWPWNLTDDLEKQ